MDEAKATQLSQIALGFEHLSIGSSLHPMAILNYTREEAKPISTEILENLTPQAIAKSFPKGINKRRYTPISLTELSRQRNQIFSLSIAPKELKKRMQSYIDRTTYILLKMADLFNEEMGTSMRIDPETKTYTFSFDGDSYFKICDLRDREINRFFIRDGYISKPRKCKKSL